MALFMSFGVLQCHPAQLTLERGIFPATFTKGCLTLHYVDPGVLNMGAFLLEFDVPVRCVLPHVLITFFHMFSLAS